MSTEPLVWTTLPRTPAIVRLVTQESAVKLVCSRRAIVKYSHRIEAYGTLLPIHLAIIRGHYYCFKTKVNLCCCHVFYITNFTIENSICTCAIENT